jgi:hypothetical protein
MAENAQPFAGRGQAVSDTTQTATETAAISDDAQEAFEQWARRNPWLACPELREFAQQIPMPEGLTDAQEFEAITVAMIARFGAPHLKRVGKIFADAHEMAELFNVRADLNLDESAIVRLTNYLAVLEAAHAVQRLPNEPTFAETLADFERSAKLRNMCRPARLN